ncbi:hypothetical protein BX616_004387, partial [Lobosporangium transversale]
MFTQADKKNSRKQKLVSGARISYNDVPYPTRLNFYMSPPSLEISIEEFEQFALDRMQVLTTLLNAQVRNMTSEQLDKNVDAAIRNQELRSWFLRAECALFRYRFEKEILSDQLEFLEQQNLSWKK